MQKIFNVVGMTCSGCQKKISEKLNSIDGISAEVNLENSTVKITSDKEISLDELNNELKTIGNYALEDPENPTDTEQSRSIPPQDRVSPSSVYYCPMECEGEKVYFEQGKRCPVCKMYLVPIEEKEEFKNKPQTYSKTNLPESFKNQIGMYFCPMFCEGDKTYGKDVGCPVCHMHLEEITQELVDSSQFSVDRHHSHHHNHSHSQQPTTINQQPSTNSQNAGKYYCPMFCEGDKVYDSNVGCPVCGMDLVKIPEKKKTEYTCPMHPEIIRNEPGSCPICGMDLVPIPSKNNEHDDDTYLLLKRKFWISVAFTVPVFILSMGGMFFDFGIPHKIQGYLELALTLPVLFYSGWFLMKRGWISFKTWNLNMFSLIALGVAVAFIFSIFALFFPNFLPHEFAHDGKVPLYFEAVCVILTLVIMGQMMEAKAHQQTGKAIEALMNLSPETANLIENNVEKKIALEDVKIGNILKVKPGEKIPVDGKIIEGNSNVDESMITGEPIPIEKKVDDTLISGTINGNGTFLMKAEKVGDDTVLSQIIKMVNEASRSKAPMQKLADKISKIFVPVVMAVAVLTFTIWTIFGGENGMSYGLINAVSILIVACPCALGLATPMSLMVGIGKGAQNGILIKNAEALELMEKVNVLITDKTGTLTEGKPSLENIKTCDNNSENEILKLAGSLNSNSEHPLSKAVSTKMEEEKIPFEKVENFENISGKGIKGTIDNKVVLLGNQKLLDQFGIKIPNELNQKIKEKQNQAKTISFLAEDGKVLGFLAFSDKIKDTSKQAIEFLQKDGVEVVMMTGDNEATARAVSEELGIKKYFANCLPEDKLKEIKNLQQQGKMVAMTGDGINDAPALAQSNVGIAMGTGTDVAIESAEITLLKGDILGVAKSKILSEKLVKNIKQNLFFAFIYNVLGIPVAAGLLYPFFGILLSPMIAAAAMSFSSLSVILNSLRLNSADLKV